MSRKSWVVTNTTRRNISIGDLMLAPTVEPGKPVNLLNFHSYNQIEQSEDLATLLSMGWLRLVKTKKRRSVKVDRLEEEEIDSKDATVSSTLTSYIDTRDFLDLTDVPSTYSGSANKVLAVRSDGLGVTFTDVTTGAPTGLNDIPDVTITDPMNNQRIVYDADTGQWINRSNPEQIVHVSSTPYTLTENSGVYIVDTSSESITVNVPEVDEFNDGEKIRVVKSTTDANTVTVQVTGQTQNIGGATTQVISFAPTGFTIIADYNGGSSSWQIVQDSRRLNGAQEGALQYWNDTTSTWTTTGTNLRYISGTNSLRLSSGSDVNAILDEDTMSSDSDTSLATQQSIKAYVDNSLASPALAVTTKTADYTVTNSDSVILCNASGTAITLDLPAASAGKTFYVKKTDSSSNTVTVDPDGSETVDGDATLIITQQYAAVTLISDGSNWFVF